MLKSLEVKYFRFCEVMTKAVKQCVLCQGKGNVVSVRSTGSNLVSTHLITALVITPQTLNNFNSQKCI
jgi:hypothetical protein